MTDLFVPGRWTRALATLLTAMRPHTLPPLLLMLLGGCKTTTAVQPDEPSAELDLALGATPSVRLVARLAPEAPAASRAEPVEWVLEGEPNRDGEVVRATLRREAASSEYSDCTHLEWRTRDERSPLAQPRYLAHTDERGHSIEELRTTIPLEEVQALGLSPSQLRICEHSFDVSGAQRDKLLRFVEAWRSLVQGP